MYQVAGGKPVKKERGSPSFFERLFGAEKRTPPPPLEEDVDQEEFYKKYNIKSLVAKAKPSFKSNEFKFLASEDNLFSIDGLPPDKKAFGVQFAGDFDKKPNEEPYCDCDVCIKKQNPSPPPPITPLPIIAISPSVIEEEKKEEEETTDNNIHKCCSCCCSHRCTRRSCSYSKPKRSKKPQKIRLVINVDN